MAPNSRGFGGRRRDGIDPSRIPPGQWTPAGVLPAARLDHFDVHNLGDDWADVTEGTPAGISIDSERCRYHATPTDAGSVVER